MGESNPLVHVVLAFCIAGVFAPVVWIRQIQKLRFAFIFGVVMIFVTVFIISGFCFYYIAERDWTRPPAAYYAINPEHYWDMIGFSFFMFEGIGAVMPVMNACDSNAQRNFPYLIALALGSLCVLYILFSELCYFTWGDDLTESIVLE